MRKIMILVMVGVLTLTGCVRLPATCFHTNDGKVWVTTLPENINNPDSTLRGYTYPCVNCECLPTKVEPKP
jgi:hypothetical protein